MNRPDPRTPGPKPPFAEREQPAPGYEQRMRQRPDHGETTYVGHGRLRDRVALVTGADSGIGRAVALAFAREGADVGISYLEEHEDARETARLVEEAQRRALLLPGDVADPRHCANIVEKTAATLGRLDVLVNNAAFQGKAVESFEDIDAERVERTFRTNIISMFHLVHAALKRLPAGGVIINVASIQAYAPSAAIVDYASTKGAIVTFTKGLVSDLAKRGIRVNCVAPGPVWTPLVMQSYPKERIAKFGADSPMERPAQPAEIAPAFVFLASDESRFVNGEVLGVTGGRPLA